VHLGKIPCQRLQETQARQEVSKMHRVNALCRSLDALRLVNPTVGPKDRSLEPSPLTTSYIRHGRVFSAPLRS
jgi:hypothetical protein